MPDTGDALSDDLRGLWCSPEAHAFYQFAPQAQPPAGPGLVRDAFGRRAMADLEAMHPARCPEAAARARVMAHRVGLQRHTCELAQVLLLGAMAQLALSPEALDGLRGSPRELAQRWASDVQGYAPLAEALGQVYLRRADLVLMCGDVSQTTPSALERQLRELGRGLGELGACMARRAGARPTRWRPAQAALAMTWLGRLLARTPEAQLYDHASALLPSLLMDLELILRSTVMIQRVHDALAQLAAWPEQP